MDDASQITISINIPWVAASPDEIYHEFFKSVSAIEGFYASAIETLATTDTCNLKLTATDFEFIQKCICFFRHFDSLHEACYNGDSRAFLMIARPLLEWAAGNSK